MRLTNRFGSASVQPLGAMLHDCVFRIDDREVRPLFDAPWRGDTGPDFDALPPIVQGLGSEWPCVPFGRTPGTMELSSEWEASDAVAWDDWAHGFSSNNEWHLDRLSPSALRATIRYHETTPIQRLVRDVRLLDDRPGLALSLTVHARQEARFPLGLHPVLSMEGAAPETMQLKIPDRARVWSFPVDAEPGRNHFTPNQQNRTLHQVETCEGENTSIQNMPPRGQTEDLLMLTDTNGEIGLSNPVLGCVTTVQWDVDQLPGCLLWVSNGGRNYYPWNGRVAALGIEPVASTFDLGFGHSLSRNTPLYKQGQQTTVTVRPGAPLVCNYAILVTPDPD